jgi:hypothetical protein
MTAGRAVVAAALAACALAGCGGSGDRSPHLGALPLAPGSRVVANVKQCDDGDNAYCALEVVVLSRKYSTSAQLVAAEKKVLAKRRWITDHASNGDEQAAESPGDKLRVTYATAYADLKDIEIGWIKRSHQISLALSRTLFDRSAAMSVMLEIGS